MITEEAKAKAAFQFKSGLRKILESVYDMHGYQNNELTTQVIEQVTDLAVLFAKRMRGEDVPITNDLAEARSRRRRTAELNSPWH